MQHFVRIINKQKLTGGQQKKALLDFDIAFNNLMCVGCLLWQKRYFKVGKLITEQDT